MRIRGHYYVAAGVVDAVLELLLRLPPHGEERNGGAPAHPAGPLRHQVRDAVRTHDGHSPGRRRARVAPAGGRDVLEGRSELDAPVGKRGNRHYVKLSTCQFFSRRKRRESFAKLSVKMPSGKMNVFKRHVGSTSVLTCGICPHIDRPRPSRTKPRSS